MRFTQLLWCLLLLLRFRFLAEAILDPVDFLALQAIRKSLDDLPGSNFFRSWDFTSDPCGFAGVYCDGDKVVSLNLGDPRAGSPGLSGRINPALGKLSALTELSIVPGRIMGALPATISQLKDLRFLAISRNFISGEPRRSSRSQNTHFELQSAHRNHSAGDRIFTGALQFDSLPQSLNRINPSVSLTNSNSNRSKTQQPHRLNRLTGTIPGRIFAFPITSLQLQRNFFYGLIQPANQVTIPNVDLSYNRFSGQISPLLSTVENLYLNSNRFTGEVPAIFVERLLSASIQTLYLQHNFLTGIQISPAAEIPVSSSLCLQYNCMVLPLETPCPLNAGPQKTRPTTQCNEWQGFSGQIYPLLSSIENLYLNRNRFSGEVPASFVERLLSASIQTLYLQHNFLTGIQISPAAEIPVSSSLTAWFRRYRHRVRLRPAHRRLGPLHNAKNGEENQTIPGRIFIFPITSLQLQRSFFYGLIQPADQVTIPTVDLSYNKFSGGISLLLSSVKNLYLNNNRFTGEVPTSIQTMYLQHNFLTGIQISPVAEIPVSSPLCLQYNCMVPPLQTPCPLKACPQKTRLLHNATNGEGMLLGPGLSPSREFFFSMHSFLCGGFAVMVALVLLTLVPGVGLRTTLFLGVIFIVLRLVPALLAVGATSSGIAIALASAARIHSLLPSVERSPSL
ncbi:hypothetical protein Bca4012_091686 [Brassica carinata]